MAGRVVSASGQYQFHNLVIPVAASPTGGLVDLQLRRHGGFHGLVKGHRSVPVSHRPRRLTRHDREGTFTHHPRGVVPDALRHRQVRAMSPRAIVVSPRRVHTARRHRRILTQRTSLHQPGCFGARHIGLVLAGWPCDSNACTVRCIARDTGKSKEQA